MTTARNKPIGRFYELQKEVSVPEDYVLTSKIRIKQPTRRQMHAFRSAQSSDEADRAFLGDQADAVFELYADRPDQEWQAFISDVWEHFYGPGVGDVEGKSEQSSE
ncbi:hypothetical protein [Nocardia sp. NPDC019302]|uniref:hypothetical protein n=1 Tax=Nocardia sp. NPDC019302 TaxID=3154592 RepID=UPI0033DD1389